MPTLLRTRITLIWLALLTATVFSWGVGHGLGFQNPREASRLIIVVAFIKVRFVILDFMEIRQAPRVMRIVAETWVIAIGAALVAFY